MVAPALYAIVRLASPGGDFRDYFKGLTLLEPVDLSENRGH